MAVYFTDKQGQTIDPYTFYHPNAIDRRLKNNIPLVRFSDIPVSTNYVNQINTICDSISMVSRWLNLAIVWTDEVGIEKLNQLAFVSKVEIIESSRMNLCSIVIKDSIKSDNTLSIEDEKLLHFQTDRMKRKIFHDNGIKGKGIRIAVFDAGFTDVDVHDAFKHLTIEKTYDFVANKEDVYGHSTHGTGVLSCIGGLYNDVPIGFATEATFLLARTERNYSEFRSEEENWLAAAEWADINGADLINSSLGYTKKRYFVEDMNGKVSLASKAAQFAFRKGMVVVNAAGNDGYTSWKYIGAPADADSVIAVGGIDPYTDLRISFSSYGPSADGRIKPEVSALGMVVLATKKNQYQVSYGTSFASPLVCGFVACFMQRNPQMSNKDVYSRIVETGSLYPYFDYAHGFGIPQADKGSALPNLMPQIAALPNITLTEKESQLELQLTKYYFEYNKDTAAVFEKNIYYHIQSPDGVLTQYKVLKFDQKYFNKNDKELPKIDLVNTKMLQANTIVRVHFEGFTASYIIR